MNKLKAVIKAVFKTALMIGVYILMLALICIFFEGQGRFIYEAF